eukprot:317329_1
MLPPKRARLCASFVPKGTRERSDDGLLNLLPATHEGEHGIKDISMEISIKSIRNGSNTQHDGICVSGSRFISFNAQYDASRIYNGYKHTFIIYKHVIYHQVDPLTGK